jgi:hypothetical protein
LPRQSCFPAKRIITTWRHTPVARPHGNSLSRLSEHTPGGASAGTQHDPLGPTDSFRGRPGRGGDSGEAAGSGSAAGSGGYWYGSGSLGGAAMLLVVVAPVVWAALPPDLAQRGMTTAVSSTVCSSWSRCTRKREAYWISSAPPHSSKWRRTPRALPPDTHWTRSSRPI